MRGPVSHALSDRLAVAVATSPVAGRPSAATAEPSMPTATAAAVARLSAEDLDLRRHMLAERLLADVIGMPWELVHDEAEEWGLEVSDRLDARLTVLLDDPATCPHGNPMPGAATPVDQHDAVAADDAPLGRVEVVRISEELEEDRAALGLLAGAGLLPGRRAEFVSRATAGLAVVGATADVVLPGHVTSDLWVRPLEDRPA